MRVVPGTICRWAVGVGALLVPLGAVLLAGGGTSVGAPLDPERAAAAPAGRLVQLKGERGCVHRGGLNRCATGRFVTSPEDIAISPDGRNVYVASYGSHAVAVFARDRRTGALAQLRGRDGCILHQGKGRRCRSARALASPSAVAVSPDGRNVYVTSAGSRALSVFARDRSGGRLRQLAGGAGCLSLRPGGDCTVARALNEPTAVAVSPDGEHVYVASRRMPSAVAIFERGAGGALTQSEGSAGCVSRGGFNGCATSHGMSGPEDLVVSRDNRSVLVAASKSDAVVTLRTGPEGLSQPAGAEGCIARGAVEGCAPGHALRGPVELAVSPDGRAVYAAASGSDAVAIMRRDRGSGALTQRAGRPGCISQFGSGGRCGSGRVLDEVWAVALSPDGANLYAVSTKLNSMSVIGRNPASGALTQLPPRYACFIRGGAVGCREGRGLTVAVAVVVSPDGRNVYAVSDDVYLGGVAVFRRYVR